MDKKLDDIVVEFAADIKKLKERLDKAVAFEYGEKEKKIRVQKKGEKWILIDTHKGVLNKRDRFVFGDCSNAKEFSLDDAIKEAEKKVK